MTRASLLAAMLFFLSSLFGQDADYKPIQVNQFWSSASVNFKPFKTLGTGSYFLSKMRSTAELGYRSEDFLGETNQLFLDLNMRRKVTDWLRAGVEYRFSLRDANTRNRGRLQLFINAKRKVGQFDVQFKSRYQRKFVSAAGERHVLRNRVAVVYRTPNFKINPKVSAEAFTWFKYSGTELSGMRYSLSANWNLPNGQEVDFGVKQDREIGVFEPTYRFIGFVAYSYDL